ncbi:MAG: undecaprenyl/decaprenyl-phosphate alpha-N-acetylglucosaminyl 1-phosphate transferase, partial [Bryobacterales bacterium]|nr:undecaprenyl/decaprenyl-phosphate alpha-N-acetylglucosaminyl 1-phosphate transferase [Bryobacterales bacterium]
IGALLGFLYYNFNPASIFLGDCGSLLIGFLLGCYGLMWNQHASTGLGMLAPLVALALPVFEVALSIFRRFLRNQPIFGSDKDHIHHRILSLGFSHRNTALVLYGVAALVAIVAVLQTILEPQFATVLLLLFAAAGYLGFRCLRYTEFHTLGRFLFAGEFRKMLRTNIHLHDYEQSMAAAKNVDDCWSALMKTCHEAHFSYVSMRVNGHHFGHELQTPLRAATRLHVTLSRSDEATFEYDPGSAAQVMLIAPLAERLQETLSRFNLAPARLGPDAPPIERPAASRAAAG